MAESVFTPEQEARINALLIEYLEQNGASIDAGINVVELTGDALTDENLKKLTIPSILPNTNQWAYTSLQNMMTPIQHAITQLQTQDTQVQNAISNASTATSAANSAAQTANTAATNANTKAGEAETAAANAEAATTGAEHVNAGLQGYTVTITDRNGVSRSVDIGFAIYDTYASVAAMNADAVNVPQGKFVVIATTDPTSTENAQMYVRNSVDAEQPFGFLCDLDQASSAAWADWLNNMKPVIEDAITTAAADHTQAVSDHQTASSDHTTAGTDHNTATTDHTQAGTDHTRAGNDHTTADTDHTQAVNDHTQAVSDKERAATDHDTAASDHLQAGSDHTTALNDHTQAGSDHTASVSATNNANSKATLANNAATFAQQQGNLSKEWNDHPPYIADGTSAHPGDLNFMYIWDITTHAYAKSEYVKGADLDYNTMTPEEYERLVENVKSSILFASVQTCEDIIDELN